MAPPTGEESPPNELNVRPGGRYDRVKRELPLAAVISGAALALTFVTTGSGVWNSVQSQFADLRSDVRSNTEHRVHHELESQKIEQRIDKLGDTVRENQLDLNKLQAMPRGGAGISYTDVQALRERIRQLEDEGKRLRNKP